MIAALPLNESARLRALREYAVLDTDAEQDFDDLTELASQLCGTPIALVSLIDSHRQWFKSKVGLDATETPREFAFCAHAILGDKPLVVADASRDERFQDNPLVTGGPKIRFYAGAPLVNPDGERLGTLCVIDTKPRQLSGSKIKALQALSRQVVSQFELRLKIAQLQRTYNEVDRLRDETQQINDKLASSNSALEQFAFMASHDLQEPLRKISTYSKLLQEDCEESLSEEGQFFLSVVLKSSKRMRNLISDLLSLSLIQQHDGPAKNVNVGDCLQIAKENLAVTIQETKAQIDGDLDIEVRADASQLIMLLQNLIGNAIKYRGDQTPVIQLSVDDHADDVQIGIRDNGIGIESSHYEQIFDVFRRLHNKDEYPGTGIGLAICKRVVECLEGRIWVESHPGSGSTFWFTIPKTKSSGKCNTSFQSSGDTRSPSDGQPVLA